MKVRARCMNHNFLKPLKMNTKKNFSVHKGEAYYATILFQVAGFLLMVKHWKGNVIKIPGGTYNGPFRRWAERGDVDGYYDNFSKKSILEKVRRTIISMLGRNFSDGLVDISEVDFLAQIITDKFGDNPAKIHAVVEFIEEVGVIPVNLVEFHQQKRGIQQFFYIATEAYAFSRDREEFIKISSETDIPTDGHDFSNQDDDVEKTVLVKTEDLTNTKGHNFAHSHCEVLEKFAREAGAENSKSV